MTIQIKKYEVAYAALLFTIHERIGEIANNTETDILDKTTNEE